VFHTSEADALLGSSGSLLPGAKVKIIDQHGKEVTEYETPGELYVQAPNVVLGYLHNEKANAETFVWREDGRWLRTGDEVLVRKSDRGFEHFFVVDRIKELIKVKVSPRNSLGMNPSLITHHRAIRSLPQSWRPIFSTTHTSPTAQ
jgi:acyl-CoA synthetase (AMP-forming)/AMP-acid ligase II